LVTAQALPALPLDQEVSLNRILIGIILFPAIYVPNILPEAVVLAHTHDPTVLTILGLSCKGGAGAGEGA